MTKRVFNACVIAVLSLAIVTGCGKSKTADGGKKVLIGFSLADLKEERWKRDRDMFVKKAEELGGKVLVKDAGGSAQTQIEQCRNLLLQGVKVLVVVPKDADAAAPIIKEAHAKGVKVISYDRLITSAPTDLYISFNNFRVGEIQAEEILKAVPKGKYLMLGGDPADKNADMLRSGQMKILQPAIDKGDITVVANPFCDKWQRSEAKRYTEDNLAQHPDISAIVASNDGTAGGAIAALRAKDLAGKVPVSGQDADLEACQNVVKGLQTVTVYKPIRQIAEASAMLAIEIAGGADVATACGKITDGTQLTVNNGSIEVPTIFLKPVPVTKDNIDETVIKDGYHSKEAVYGK